MLGRDTLEGGRRIHFGWYNAGMRYRRFGRTELSMPVFSCGGMRYQFRWQDRPFDQIPKDNQENLSATIHRAVELGINHIETARGYGTSERQLGYVLSDFSRDSLIVQTKVAPTADPVEFRRNVEESLERLQLDRVDLLALHGINNEETLDWAVRPGGCFDEAQRFRQAGKCRYVGFSTHGTPDIVQKAVEYGEPETGKGFDYVNLHWYFIYQRNWPAVLAAHQRDMGVFIISPSDKGGQLYKPPPKLKGLCEPLSPMVFNDLFCLSHPEVHTLSLGAARPSDFDEHQLVLPLLDEPHQHLEPVVAQLRQAMQQATGSADPEANLLDLPRWEDTPGEMNLAIIGWLLNLARGWDMVDYAKTRFNLLGNADHWFGGNRPKKPTDIDSAALKAALGDHPLAPEAGRILKAAFELLGGQEQQRLSAS